MSDFNKDTVLKVAKLARLHVEEAEAESLASELSGILDWIEKLSEVDTHGVPQLASVSDVALPWRADEVSDGNVQEQVLKNAPKSVHGCFSVPKVIE